MINKRKKIFVFLIGIIFIINNLCIEARAINNNKANIIFKSLTVDDGLAQSTVKCIFQDSKGYMWFGTANGLNRYNGKDFEVYKYKDGEENKISSNNISIIKEDLNNNIWIGTNVGLNKINLKTNEITMYYTGVNGCNISNNNITDILISSNGKLYISTKDGLNLYDEESDNFIRLYGEKNSKTSLTSEIIYSIDEDLNGNLWLGTNEGLNKINLDSNEIIKYYDSKSSNSISDDFIYKIYADNQNNLWIGTYNSGLYRLDIENNNIEHYENNTSDDNSIASNSIRYILEDSNSNIWVATSKGLSRLDKEKNKFINYKSNKYDTNSLINNDILSLYEDNLGLIWIGTHKGISILNNKSSFTYYRSDYLNSNYLSDNMISGIYKDNDGLIWVGTYEEGINVIDKENGTTTQYKVSDNYKSIIDNNIRDITGIDNEIWIASENGLTKYDKNTNKFTQYFSDYENSILLNDIRHLYIDRDGELWISTSNGVYTFDRKSNFKSYDELFLKNNINGHIFSEITEDHDGEIWIGSAYGDGLIRLNKKTEIIKSYKNQVGNENSISYNIVNTIKVDENNTVWVGTEYGLNKFNKDDEVFTGYYEKDGLSNEFIYGILIDDEGDLWISTNYGISNFKVKDNKFINYDIKNGLLANEFNKYSYHKGYDGEMFFGCINGLITFYPENLQEDEITSKVAIESVYTNNNEILDLEEIELSYKSNNISFDFFLPDYRDVKKVEYAYKLEGLDNEWKWVGNSDYANYTNLEAGKYTFLVTSKYNNGEWSEPTTISFTVKVKPWKSTYAYMIYLLIFFIVIYIIWNKVKILNAIVEQRTNDLNKNLKENEKLYKKLIKNERYKNNYFINLSHELRTTLNVIISVEQLITKLNDDKKHISREKLYYYMRILRRNSDRLLRLINNIINTSKIESGAYILDIKKYDIVYLVEEIALSMREYIKAKGIDLIIDPEIEEKTIECDAGEIEKCIINLIDNAVKFTEAGGKIEVKLMDLGNFIKISVKDTGIGIDKEFHNSIFDRFTQAYKNSTEEFGGSGLGLTLTKKLINLHNGEIYVQSEVNKGSEFIILLPISQN